MIYLKAERHLLLSNFEIYELTKLLLFFIVSDNHDHNSYLQSPSNASFLKVLWSQTRNTSFEQGVTCRLKVEILKLLSFGQHKKQLLLLLLLLDTQQHTMTLRERFIEKKEEKKQTNVCFRQVGVVENIEMLVFFLLLFPTYFEQTRIFHSRAYRPQGLVSPPLGVVFSHQPAQFSFLGGNKKKCSFFLEPFP